MALVSCEDCGHQVSSEASACPQCGRPMRAPQVPPAMWPPPQKPKAAGAPPSGGNSQPKNWFARHKVLTVILALIVLGIIAAAAGNSSDTHGGGGGGQASKPAGKADFSIVLNKSSCWEDLSSAYVRCDIKIHNKGTAGGGIPDVDVLVRYSDGSSTIFTNTTDALNNFSEPNGHNVSKHSYDDVYFAHSYNEQGHALLQAAVSLDLNAKQYPYIRVKSPQG
jgi:hypothetical protein